MKLKSIALAAAATVIFPASAEAAVYMITFNGIVKNGFDYTGEFGLPGSDLTGAIFQSVYTFDDSISGVNVITNGVDYRTVKGGQAFGNISPISAKFTINGITQVINGNSFGIIDITNQYNGFNLFDQLSLSSSNYQNTISHNFAYGLNNAISSKFNDFLNFITPPNNFSYLPMSGDVSTGDFTIVDQDLTSGSYQHRAFGTLLSNSISISSPSAVPESASWAMFISGFGLIGGGMRYRQRRRSVSFA